MKYIFYKEVIETTGTVILGVMPEEERINVLFRFSDSGWTTQKIQEIIDKVESNRSLEKTKNPYVWGNEDVTVFANELGVLLVDKLAMRAKQEVEPLELTHDEFITFMKDFKKFIEENS
ncbi:hypothetical protein ACFPVY_11885 [Flavobacterium qiangtangense]|uniref:Uncharacterized protein n=1 Tax=Flavobacterium qiangtangense TaxID=1442595 RepID=A0ABW1PNX9_9FLAO